MNNRTATDAPIQRVWTAADVIALGVRTDVPTAGAILAGLCKDEAYRSVKRGDFPVPVVRVGHRLVVPVAPILELLGIKPGVTAADLAPPSPAVEDADAPLAAEQRLRSAGLLVKGGDADAAA